MEGGYSLILGVIWILVLGGIFAVARILPWWPLRMLVNGFGMLLVAVTLWNLVGQFLFWFRRS
jgi:hypothetical protein